MKKLENQKKILKCLYEARFIESTPYLSTNGIVLGTNLPNSTVKGWLQNLVKKGWIEKRSLISATNIEKRRIRQELVKITIKGKNNFWTYIPIDVFNEFETKLFKLKRTKKSINLQGEIKITEEIYYKVMKQMDKRKTKRIQKYYLPFKGRTRLIKSIKNWTVTRKKNFYKILVFPYIIDDRFGGHTKSTTKKLLKSRWKDIPKKDKEYWRDEARQIHKHNSKV